MRNTAYFLAAAVWNEDLAGSDRFRDLLVRWVQIFYAQLQHLYPFRDALMLTPDLLRAEWPDAQAAAIRTLMYPYPQQPGAKPVFGIVLREAYYDGLAITAAVLLHWFATKRQPSSATAQTAMLVLRREMLADSGNTLLEPGAAAKSIFRLVFDLLVREALHSRSDEAKYGEAIYMTGSRFPTEGLESYGLTREAGANSGVGCTYVGTFGKIHIYSWQFSNAGILCSRTLLRSARFGRVHDLDAIFDFELYDSGDPTKSMVRMWLATEFEWEDRRVIEFGFSNLADGPLEGQKNPDV